MSLLTKNNLIDIKIYYQEIKNRGGSKIKVLSKKEADLIMDNNAIDKKNFEDKEENKEKTFELDPSREVHILNTKWAQASWREQNEALKDCLNKNDFTGEFEIDQLSFRDKKVKNCLKEWDIKDDSGQPVPVSPQTIDELPFDVIIALVSEYDKSTDLEEEDEKKS